MATGEGLAGSQAPRPPVMTGASPINVGRLHVAQAAGLRAGQQEQVCLGGEGGVGGRKQHCGEGWGQGSEEDQQEGSPPPAAGSSGPADTSSPGQCRLCADEPGPPHTGPSIFSTESWAGGAGGKCERGPQPGPPLEPPTPRHPQAGRTSWGTGCRCPWGALLPCVPTCRSLGAQWARST